MSNEFDALIDEVAQLGVGALEVCQVLLGVVRIQVPRLDARELSKVVDHLFLGADVVVQEGNAFLGALPECTNRVK